VPNDWSSYWLAHNDTQTFELQQLYSMPVDKLSYLRSPAVKLQLGNGLPSLGGYAHGDIIAITILEV